METSAEPAAKSAIFMGSIPGVASTGIEVATLRKLRLRLLPFLLALYVIAFLDRTNLGFAALTMNRELGITSEQFGLAAGIFFWGYFLLEIPSNLILHKNRGAGVDRPDPDHLGISRRSHRICAVCPSALCRALCSWARGSGILSRYCSVPGLLASVAGKSTSAGADHHRHSPRERPGRSGFRAHSGPRALVRLERLAVVADPGRIARNSVRFFDESTAAKRPRRRGFSPRRKRLGSPINWSAKSGRSPSGDRFLWHEL